MRVSAGPECHVEVWSSSSFEASAPASRSLVLDLAERRIRGVDMQPLLTGELKLLSFLGGRPRSWHTSYALSLRVYGRDDGSARQLVWKYASTLRKKLAKDLPALLEVCHRRGYSCRHEVTIIDPEGDAG